MKELIQYVNDLKEKTGSDNKSAQALNIERTTIANIRKRGQMSDETAIKIADYLGIDRTEVLLAATIARSEGEVKASWERISKLSGLAAGIVMFSAINLANSSAGSDLESIQSPIMYIMLNYNDCVTMIMMMNQ